MKKILLAAAASVLIGTTASAAPVLAPPAPIAADFQQYVSVPAGRTALTHVRIIDGTGAAPVEDQTLLIDGAKIAAVQPASAPVPAGYHTIDGSGMTVLPGLVGMHNHLFYLQRPNLDASGHFEQPIIIPQMTFSAPRLYLANGVTTMRTTGSVEPYTDLALKREIDAGRLIGPHLDVTGPYLEGAGAFFIQNHVISSPDDARKEVAFWADQGVNSFKAYMNISRAELGAAIKEAHRHGLKVTGHLCSVTYPEAIAAGIDDLEHGFLVNTDLAKDKQPDVCPIKETTAFVDHVEADSAEAKALIASLVAHKVAITSTLPVFENALPNRPPLNPRAMDTLTTEARTAYLFARNRAASQPAEAAARITRNYQRNLAMERAFFKAGGLLLAGCDPTGNGGTIPGFADLRELELLVEGGFTPLEAIRVGTLNGAIFLGRDKTIGSVEAGKNADLLVVMGDPSKTIAEVANVELVFKDGVAFDPTKLLDSVKGRYGQY